VHTTVNYYISIESDHHHDLVNVATIGVRGVLRLFLLWHLLDRS
jgi:hypothetical protein